MVKVHFDISLFTMDAAFGMVSGPFEVAVVPQAGDVIDFSLPGACTAFVGERKLPFVGQLRVTDRIIPAKGVAEVTAMKTSLRQRERTLNACWKCLNRSTDCSETFGKTTTNQLTSAMGGERTSPRGG